MFFYSKLPILNRITNIDPFESEIDWHSSSSTCLGDRLGNPPPWEDIVKQDGSCEIRVRVPGFNKSSLSVQLTGITSRQPFLEIKGYKKITTKQGTEDKVPTFYESIDVNSQIDPESIKATCEDGILRISYKLRGKENTSKNIEIT